MEPRKAIGSDFFVYQVQFLALAAGGSSPGSFTVEADSDFKLMAMAYVADVAGAAQTDSTRVLPLVTLNIKPGNTGRDLMTTPVPITALMGDGRLPYLLPRAKIIKAQTTVTLAVANFSAATAYNLRLSFLGEKLFYA